MIVNGVNAVSLLREFVRSVLLVEAPRPLPKRDTSIDPSDVPEHDIEKAGLGLYALPTDNPLAFGNVSKAELERIDPDTAAEKKLRADLARHFSTAIESLPKKDNVLIKQALENGWYKSTLREPTVPFVYRGLSMAPERLASAINIPVDQLQPGDRVELGRLKLQTSRVPDEGSSWSKSFHVARQFMNDSGATGLIGAVFVARPSDNPHVFLDTRNLYPPNPHEREALALDNEVVVCAVVIVPNRSMGHDEPEPVMSHDRSTHTLATHVEDLVIWLEELSDEELKRALSDPETIKAIGETARTLEIVKKSSSRVRKAFSRSPDEQFRRWVEWADRDDEYEARMAAKDAAKAAKAAKV